MKSFPTPWSIAPRRGKYYSTVILDANGDEVFRLARTTDKSKRSRRESPDIPEAVWREQLSDYHWESEEVLELAEFVVGCANALLARDPSLTERLIQSCFERSIRSSVELIREINLRRV